MSCPELAASAVAPATFGARHGGESGAAAEAPRQGHNLRVVLATKKNAGALQLSDTWAGCGQEGDGKHAFQEMWFQLGSALRVGTCAHSRKSRDWQLK